jgi:hypothetical protein
MAADPLISPPDLTLSTDERNALALALLKADLTYARMGWATFLCHSPNYLTGAICDCSNPGGRDPKGRPCKPAKHPWMKNGCSDATTDEATIRQRRMQHPWANVGINVGMSALFVLDADPRHDGDVSLRQFIADHAPADDEMSGALIQDSGGGGEHYVWPVTDERPGPAGPNKASIISQYGGVDVRGGNSYILVAPSRHESGGEYGWRGLSVDALATRTLAVLPAWLDRASRERPPRPVIATPPEVWTPRPPGGGVITPHDGHYWLDRGVLRAHPGNRDNACHWMAQQMHWDAVSQSEAEALAEQFAERVGTDGSFSVEDARKCVRSAYRQPMRVPARRQGGSVFTASTQIPKSAPAIVTPSAEPEAAAAAAAQMAEKVIPLYRVEREASRSETDETDEGEADRKTNDQDDKGKARADGPWPDDLYPIYYDDEVEALKPPKGIVGDVLFEESVSWLYGPSGRWKTFATLDIALCVATGRAWQGKTVIQGDVLYICAEGMGGIGTRITAWKIEHGMVGRRTALRVQGIPVVLNDPSAVDRLVRSVRALEMKPRLIVIDTLAASNGEDEQSAQTAGIVTRAAREIIKACNGACVLIVHHPGYDTSHMRGSSGYHANSDFVIRVEGPDPTRPIAPGETIRLVSDKSKDATPFAPIVLTAKRVEWVTDKEGEPRSSLVMVKVDAKRSAAADLKLQPTEQTGLQALGDLLSDHLTSVTGGVWQKRMVEECGMEAQTAKNVRQTLRNKRCVTYAEATGHWALGALGKAALKDDEEGDEE